ncbi:hypothetical protein OBBRIDRAFT_805620 [Obba rivulosa]|uniref:Uncharacterized protein n=1 Tax=Obba rivulosa TaxID=1052685 RepID=A0A8E2ATI5_9APHY|nr:hypothetical protein OBBRIDRAFT_805620 [Obba rivulosa]
MSDVRAPAVTVAVIGSFAGYPALSSIHRYRGRSCPVASYFSGGPQTYFTDLYDWHEPPVEGEEMSSYHPGSLSEGDIVLVECGVEWWWKKEDNGWVTRFDLQASYFINHPDHLQNPRPEKKRKPAKASIRPGHPIATKHVIVPLRNVKRLARHVLRPPADTSCTQRVLPHAGAILID